MIKWLERKVENGVAKLLNTFDPQQSEKEKSNKKLGNELEYRVFKDLEHMGLKVLHSCYIETKGNYTEIDIIAIGETGVYVLELKNFRGKIVMTEGKDWVVYYGDKKFNLYNPYLQNEGHIKWLSRYLNNMGLDKFHNIVVFPNEATLYNRDINKKVILEMEIVHYIVSLESKYKLNEPAMQSIYDKIKPTTDVSDLVRRKQIKSAKNYKREREGLNK